MNDDGRQSMRESIVTGSGSFSNLDPDAHYNLKKGVYDQVKNDEAALNESAILAQFVDSASATNLGVQSEVEEMIGSIVDTVQQTIDTALLQQAVETNLSVLPENNVESNLKVIREIYLATVVKGIYEFTASQKALIEYVAFQCPALGGNVVYEARAMMMLYNDSIVFDDTQLCIVSSGNRFISGNENPNLQSVFPGFILKPNPADNEVLVLLDEKHSDGYIELNDIAGKTLEKIKIKSVDKSAVINLKQFAEGTYFIIHRETGKSPVSYRLVIIR